MKFILKITIVSLILLTLRIITPFLDLYPYRITKEYLLIGYFPNNYCIKKGLFGKILIHSLERDSEWMIDSSYIYGHRGNRFNLVDDYFLVNSNNDSVIYFGELHDLNNYLRNYKLKSFNMTDCESVHHLRLNQRKHNP